MLSASNETVIINPNSRKATSPHMLKKKKLLNEVLNVNKMSEERCKECTWSGRETVTNI